MVQFLEAAEVVMVNDRIVIKKGERYFVSHLFLYDELSSQKRQLMKENLIGRFPLETFSRSRIYKK